MFIQLLRTPAARRSVLRYHKPLFGTDIPPEDVPSGLFGFMIGGLKKWMEATNEHLLVLIAAPPSSRFVISDAPVGLMFDPGTAETHSAPAMNLATVFMPISAYYCMGLVPPHAVPRVIGSATPTITKIMPEPVSGAERTTRDMNALQVLNSIRFLMSVSSDFSDCIYTIGLNPLATVGQVTKDDAPVFPD
jgi:hypothetical protein